MAYEYVYLIKPDTYPLVKIGRWSGTVSDLRSRYSTYYARFDMTIFQCKDSIVTENVLHRECAEFNECRELYRLEAIDTFNRVAATCCETFCHSRDLEDAKTRIALKRAKNIAEENRNLKRKLAKLEEKAENDKRKEEEKTQKAAQKQAEKEEAERAKEEAQRVAVAVRQDPMMTFLRESCAYEEHSKTSAEHIKMRFAEHLGKLVCPKLDRGTFAQADPRWKVKGCHSCRVCGSTERNGCCDRYKNSERKKSFEVINMRLLNKSL